VATADKNYDISENKIFDMLNETYVKFYNPSEHSAVDKITVLFKGTVIFKQNIPKEH
jgi:hypothetical protein